MFQFLKNLFGFGTKVNYAQLVADGAIIVDVRTKGEFQQGHIKNALNIPLDTILNQLSKLNKNKTIITCCASGMRSAQAKSILKSNGYIEVYNGGGWSRLQNKIN